MKPTLRAGDVVKRRNTKQVGIVVESLMKPEGNIYLVKWQTDGTMWEAEKTLIRSR